MINNLTGHMVVKNEDRWIWFSIMSVIDYVDKLIIFDTGSSDDTVKIIKDIMSNERYSSKIVFEEKGAVDKQNFYHIREEQISMTETDYFIVVDGDEIWYENSIKEVINAIRSSNPPYLIANKFINCAGDIYHYRDFKRETYTIKEVTGSLTIRVYSKKITGIHCGGDYGVEGYFDYLNKPVQESKWNIEIMNGSYLHTSLLQRSSNIYGDMEIGYRRKKILSDWDYKFDENFKFPEVLYIKRPDYVFDPFSYEIDWIRKLIYMLRSIKKKIRKG
ncbi:hypothetical protein CFOLD11_40990 [Clostridium folliculivorans]|uniref:Glycosyltransferase 2-like domain-containing protein n=1 Tax=Clostridium folliculivorans TaxID=2886038 RepID=A0A9W6DCR6_9CLOT|nr:glycosyltransferase [Clostridium folliculivorans]GKU27272.1 hypothetical protein CFOLD11_40990 [Clostridium folliculivorans]